MPEESEPIGQEENLREENDFLKMKLMLEHGAEFGTINDDALPAEMENEFLRNIIAFEKSFEDRKYIKVYDKIGRPQQFKAAADIPDEDIDIAWEELRDYLNKHGIDLGVCSPNISKRELYRFTVEELFEKEMDDMNLAGWTTHFTYDEFYPDPIYESERTVIEHFLPALFNTELINEHFYCLQNKDIRLNGKLYSSHNDVKSVFNRFKFFFKKIDLEEATAELCKAVSELLVTVTGNYRARATGTHSSSETIFEGTFLAELSPDELGYWSIKSMHLEGISFG